MGNVVDTNNTDKCIGILYEWVNIIIHIYKVHSPVAKC